MKWIEVIQLRSAGSNREILEHKLNRLIDDFSKRKKNPEMMAYSRALIDSDFSIQLLHDSNEVETGGSHLGLRLVSAFKEFGLVHHSIWIELNS